MWLINEGLRVGLVLLPAGIVAGLLVLYFDWRTRLVQRITDGPAVLEEIEEIEQPV